MTLFEPRQQRSRGMATVAIGSSGRVQRFTQSGAARAVILTASARHPEVVFLNTSGGLTSGDRLEYALTLEGDARATATTQTAERVYRAATGPARVRVRLCIGAAAHLDWLPQETILFQASRLQRSTEIDLSEGATCLALEAVALGRVAMGETVSHLSFDDYRTIRRSGRTLVLEPLRLRTGTLGLTSVLGPARAFASLVLVSPGAQDACGPVRALLNEPGVDGGASGWNGRLLVRLLARDPWPLKRQIVRLLDVLRPGPLPRVWQM